MTAHELLKQIQLMVDEIGGDGETIGSHKIPSGVMFMTENPDDDASYELVEIAPNRLLGCGCWSGIIFNLKRIPEPK